MPNCDPRRLGQIFLSALHSHERLLVIVIFVFFLHENIHSWHSFKLPRLSNLRILAVRLPFSLVLKFSEIRWNITNRGCSCSFKTSKGTSALRFSRAPKFDMFLFLDVYFCIKWWCGLKFWLSTVCAIFSTIHAYTNDFIHLYSWCLDVIRNWSSCACY